MNLHGKNILLIEDDQHIFTLVKAMLKPYDVKLILKKDGEAGLKDALTNKYHLILLDIMLPKKDGWEVCKQLKDSNVETPIIMLTAKVSESDKVLGLEIGADDYVTKPFSPRELIARIKAILRRFEKTNNSTPSTEQQLNFSEIGLTIDVKSHNVRIKEKSLKLAPKEFELLSLLAHNANQVYTRKQILEQIWGYENDKKTRTVDEHVKRLRKKLNEAGLVNPPLKTVWGVGYKFEIGEMKHQ